MPVTPVSPRQVRLHLDVAETGSTFAENATIKAVAYAKASGLVTMADDSGLEVDALNGEPGVFSARYAGPEASDAQRIDYLLEKLLDVPCPKRTARFRCVIAIAQPDGPVFHAEGTVCGLVAHAPRGSRGFGYDPIVYLPSRHKTMAQLPTPIKNLISHRANALRAALPTIHRLATCLAPQ
jgi:XTP/dITP diphosphohydrolase